MNILFYDTETTGLPSQAKPADDPTQAHLVQIALILADEAGNEIDQYSEIVNPGDDVVFQPDAVKAHGITQERAKAEGVDPKEASDRYLDMLDKADLVVGHNVQFDNKVMTHAIARTHNETLDPKVPIFCTMAKSTDIVAIPPTEKMMRAGRNHYKNPNLTECIAHFFNEELEDAHDALADVRGSMRVFYRLQELGVSSEYSMPASADDGSEDPLIAAVKKNPKTVLGDEEKRKEFLVAVRAQAMSGPRDSSTKKGREAITSAAYAVSQLKTHIDKAGQKMTENWRKKTVEVNAVRNTITAEMDAIRDEVKAPVTSWKKQEQERQQIADGIIAELKEGGLVRIDETAEQVQARIDYFKGLNTIVEENFGDQTDSVSQMREDVVRQLTEAVEGLKVAEKEAAELAELRAERDRREEEKRKEEEAKAAAEAEKRRQEEEAAAAEAEKQRIREAEEAAAERAREEERRKADEEARAKIAEANERAAQAERDAQAERERAEQAEKDRIAAEEKEAEEQRKREADAQHRNEIIEAAASALASKCGISKADAHKVVGQIETGNIPAISITF